MLEDFVFGALPLDRQHPAAGPQQRACSIWSACPAKPPPATPPHPSPPPRRAPPDPRHGPAPPCSRCPSSSIDLAKKVAAAEQRFDQHHAHVRPRQRQRYPGQPGTTTDVGDPLAAGRGVPPTTALLRIWRSHSRSHLAGSEQSPLDPGAGEDLARTDRPAAIASPKIASAAAGGGGTSACFT